LINQKLQHKKSKMIVFININGRDSIFMKKLKKFNKIIAVLFVLCIVFQNIAFAEPTPSDESVLF